MGDSWLHSARSPGAAGLAAWCVPSLNRTKHGLLNSRQGKRRCHVRQDQSSQRDCSPWGAHRKLTEVERNTVVMSIQEVSPEELAELFHHYHQALGPDFGCTSSQSTLESWDERPQPEKSRAVAPADLALPEIASTARDEEDSRKYFAKPGEAEWGC